MKLKDDIIKFDLQKKGICPNIGYTSLKPIYGLYDSNYTIYLLQYGPAKEGNLNKNS